MAEFDPVIQPTNDPSYTRDSRGVDVPRTPGPDGVATNQIMPKGVAEPDRSAEYAGKAAAFAGESEGASMKGYGDLFAGITGLGDFVFKGADAIIKKNIEREVYDISKREQDAEISRLEQILGGKPAQDIFRDKLAGGGDTEDELPADLRDLPDTVARYKEGSESSGPAMREYYAAKVHAEAKNLRAKYPMYAPYIDEQFKAFTGMDPANARITAMTSQINRAQNSVQAQQNRMITEVMKRSGWAHNGVNSVQAIENIRSGKWTSMTDVANWAYPGDRLEAVSKAAETELKLGKMSREERAQRGHDAAFTLLAGNSEVLINQLMAQFQVKDTQELRLKLRDNKDSKWWQDRVVELEVARDQFENTMFKALTKNGKDSIAVAMNLKPDQVREYIKGFNKEFDSVIESARRQDGNGIAGAANRIKAKTDASVEFMLNDPNVREFALAGAAAQKLFGNNPRIAEEFVNRALDRGFTGKYGAALEAHSNWLSLGASTPGAQVPAFNKTFNELKNRGVLTKNASNKLIALVDQISDPKISDEEKYSLAISAFGTANRGFIRNIKPDFQDENGKRVMGQWGVFQRWTSESNAKEIKRLDAKYPGLWNTYKDWAESTMVNDLLPDDIRALNALDKESNFDVKWKASKNGIREMELIPRVDSGDGTGTQIRRHISGGKLPQERQLEATVSRINSALSRYSTIAKTDGGDPDAVILQSLLNGRLDRDSLITDKMIQAMKLTRIKEKQNAGGNK